MPFSDKERAILMAAPLVGKTIIKRIESCGIHDLATLAQADASLLCEHIGELSGIKGWATHSMALASVGNAIEAAKKEGLA